MCAALLEPGMAMVKQVDTTDKTTTGEQYYVPYTSFYRRTYLPTIFFCIKLKRLLVLPDASQFIHVEMFDAITEGFEYLGLPFQEVGACEIHRRGVVGIQFAVASQQFEEGEQFLHQFALCQRGEFTSFGFLQERSSWEECQAASAYEHRLALVEYLGGVDGMLMAVFTPCHAVEESHPILDAGLFQLLALQQDVLGGIALVDALERPVIATLHAQRDFVHSDFLQPP